MKLSIIIKAFNEEANIARTIESCLAALEGIEGEVILADSLSTDRTLEIALSYPVTIVQLEHAAQRGCGTAPQLGYQYSSGDFIYLIDGDMVLYKDFLHEALNHLEKDESLAGVGGIIRDINLDNLEYAARAARSKNESQFGDTDRLNGGGLYRRSAIESVGYLSDPNLHAFEEFELGARLRTQGWRLIRLDRVSVDHYGYSMGAYKLLWQRVKSGYALGAGEIARAALGTPYFYEVLQKIRTLWISALALIWLSASLIVALMMEDPISSAFVGSALLLAPIAIMSARRRSLRLGIYAVAVWIVLAFCSIGGILRRRTEPALWIPSRLIKGGTSATYINRLGNLHKGLTLSERHSG